MNSNITLIHPSTRDAIVTYMRRTHRAEATLEEIRDVLGPSLHVLDLRA